MHENYCHNTKTTLSRQCTVRQQMTNSTILLLGISMLKCQQGKDWKGCLAFNMSGYICLAKNTKLTTPSLTRAWCSFPKVFKIYIEDSSNK